MKEDKTIVMGIEPTEEVKEEKEAPKRSPFALWNVGGKEYRMKLSTASICKLENAYKTNLLNLILEDDLPPLSTMLTIIHTAIADYNHGITFLQVQKMFDEYVESGKSQSDLFAEVLIPIYRVSGFFTKEMEEALAEGNDL